MLHTYLPVLIAIVPAIAIAVLGFALAKSDRLSKLLADTTHQEKRLSQIEALVASETAKRKTFQRDVMDLFGKLPETYVRRDDWIEAQSRNDRKLDAIGDRMQEILMRLPPRTH